MKILSGLLLVLAAVPSGGLDCGRIPGSELVVKDGVALILGEIHGTREGPGVVGDLVCQALSRDLPTTVALEWPQTDQSAVERYLNGAGAAEDRASLLGREFWSRQYQDGRSSQAMFGLLERLRGYKASGLPVKVVLLDDATVPADRDRAMANRLLAAASGAKGLLVSLTGNLHNHLNQGSRWDPDYRSMGYFVKNELTGLKLISLDLTHEGGEAWICTGSSAADCGSMRLKGKKRPLGIQLDPTPGAAFSGTLQLGPITASPPAAKPSQPPAQ